MTSIDPGVSKWPKSIPPLTEEQLEYLKQDGFQIDNSSGEPEYTYSLAYLQNPTELWNDLLVYVGHDEASHWA